MRINSIFGALTATGRWAALGLSVTALTWESLDGAEVAASAAATSPAAAVDSQSHELLEKNLRTALWMRAYDQVAWATTDLLLKENKETLKKVGPVWFCMEKDHAWYAVYGVSQANAFDIAVCYRKGPNEKFEKVNAPAFPDRDRFATAINLTLPEILDTTRRTSVRFNYYVRGEGDTIAIYYLPAFQVDGKLAYGIQHTYFLDRTGGKVISHERHGEVLIGSLLRKDRTITLETPECLVPTPQSMFTMMSYRQYFADVVTHCQTGYYNVAEQNGDFVCKLTYQPAPDNSWQKF